MQTAQLPLTRRLVPRRIRLTTTPAVIVAGMHRSGTSMVARSLERCGLELGDEIYPTDAHNPLGYYEDLAFMTLGQQMARAACDPGEVGHHDWGVVLSERLDRDAANAFREPARALVEERRRRGAPWGFKDPRATLFLDFWRELVPEARFVLVYRAPWDVIDSTARLGEGPFARRPEIAAAAWSLYNRALLDFAQRWPKRCVVLPAASLVARPEAAARALAGAAPAVSAQALASGVSSSLLSLTPEGDPAAAAVRERWPQLETLLARLDAAAAVRA